MTGDPKSSSKWRLRGIIVSPFEELPLQNAEPKTVVLKSASGRRFKVLEVESCEGLEVAALFNHRGFTDHSEIHIVPNACDATLSLKPLDVYVQSEGAIGRELVSIRIQLPTGAP